MIYRKFKYSRTQRALAVGVSEDTGTKIRINLNDNGVKRIYSLDKVIYKIFTGKHDFADTKIKIIHKDGNYKNCSFYNLDCELV